MADWLKTLLIAAIGGCLSGGFLLLADYFRSRRRLRERLQEVLAEKRIVASSELMGMLIEFNSEFGFFQHSLRGLHWQLEKDLSQEEKEHAQKITDLLYRLSHFVEVNQLILGEKVHRAWERHFSVLSGLLISLRAKEIFDASLILPFNNALLGLIDAIGSAIVEQLRGIVEFVPSAQWQRLRNEALAEAKEIVAKAKAEFEARTSKNNKNPR